MSNAFPNAAADLAAGAAVLADWLTEPNPATVATAADLAALLPRVLEAVPPTIADLDLMCYLRNRLRSSLRLAAEGDRFTAAYQLRELSRKLTTRARGT